MTRKQKRVSVILAGLAVLGVAAGLVLFALRDSIVFFYTPSEIVEKGVKPGQRLRLGGLVEKGSWKKGEGTLNRFLVTDRIKTLPVSYSGPLPDLFRQSPEVTSGPLNIYPCHRRGIPHLEGMRYSSWEEDKRSRSGD